MFLPSNVALYIKQEHCIAVNNSIIRHFGSQFIRLIIVLLWDSGFQHIHSDRTSQASGCTMPQALVVDLFMNPSNQCRVSFHCYLDYSWNRFCCLNTDTWLPGACIFSLAHKSIWGSISNLYTDSNLTAFGTQLHIFRDFQNKVILLSIIYDVHWMATVFKEQIHLEIELCWSDMVSLINNL